MASSALDHVRWAAAHVRGRRAAVAVDVTAVVPVAKRVADNIVSKE